MSQLKPKSDYVVATPYEASSKTKSGIFIPETAKEKNASLANVVTVGSDVKDIKPKDLIVFKSYSGTEIKYDNTNYLLIDMIDVIAKVEP